MRGLTWLALNSLLLCACSNVSVQGTNSIPHQQAKFKTPAKDMQFLKGQEFIAAMEAELLVNKHPVWEQPKMMREYEQEPEDWFVCGISVVDGYEIDGFDNAAKFRVVGATEGWIPIDGKVTKVLHLQMVNNW